MKKFLLVCASLAALTILIVFLYTCTDFYLPFGVDTENPELWAKTGNKEILIKEGEAWTPFVARGVNLGAGEPGSFATDYIISYDTYMRWFKQIQEMNANLLRVYTILGPEFYRAFYDYNRDNPQPLYLIQGVWVDDYVLRNRNHAYDKTLRGHFKQDISKMIDVLHGRRTIFFNSRHGYGTYRWDVSDWVLGYILGVEWQSDQVLYTDHTRDDVAGFDGEYLYTTPQATPFESLLCEMGDHTISYETRKYGQQRLVAFSNWTETDPLEHEVYMEDQIENRAHVDTEHIKAHESFQSGLFASYHVYPYYPEFLNFERTYTSFVDETGAVNPYRAYLMALNEHHDVPVMIGEFGIPTSRGISHEDAFRGLNQGQMNEQEQGKALVTLFDDILKAGCSGGIVFTWQDEWFKRTWNTMYAVDLTREPYWADIQTNEEFFGLMAFDPGKEKSVCYVDGDVSEWAQAPPIAQGDGLSLSMLYDEAFVYLRVHFAQGSPREQPFYLPLDLTPKSGATWDKATGLSFARPVDFLIRIDGENHSEILAQEYYCPLWANYRREIHMQDAFIYPPSKDSPRFMDIDLYLRDRLQVKNIFFVPEWDLDNIDESISDAERVTLKAQLFPTGELRHGDANPDHKEFDSIADFCFGEQDVEIRIPYQLLNFTDASTMTIHDDYYANYGVEEIAIDRMYAAVQTLSGRRTPFGQLPLKGWGRRPTAHERLKRSYFILQEAFAQYAREEAG